MHSYLLSVLDVFCSASTHDREQTLQQLADTWLRIAIGQTCP